MESIKLNRDVCRICLENEVTLNWNDEIFVSCGMTYKDCYYKYTQLMENGSDYFPTNLCENCGNELKNAHMLLEKAVESYNILRIALDDKYPDENTLIEIVQSALYVKEGVTTTENVVSNPEDSSIKDKIEIEPAHFPDITNLETQNKTPLEQEFTESGNKATKKRRKNKTYRSSLDAVESCNSKLYTTKPMESIEESRKSLTESRLSHNESIINVQIQRLSSEELLHHDNIEKCETKSLTSIRENRKSLNETLHPPNESVINVKISSEELLQHDNIEGCKIKSLTHNLTEYKPRKKKLCQYCSLKVRENYLKAHEATHEEHRERKETCPQCGIKLYNKEALSIHMKIHRENREKEHKCEFCEKAFFNKGSLNIHRRIHLGLMVKCQICSKEYYRQVDLNKHLLIHSAFPPHKKGEKIKYKIQCRYCDKNISTDSWREHKAAHLNQPETKCKICDKDFFSRSSCTHHLKKVHGIREYDKFIYYYINPNTRMSHLMMEQQERVRKLTE